MNLTAGRTPKSMSYFLGRQIKTIAKYIHISNTDDIDWI